MTLILSALLCLAALGATGSDDLEKGCSDRISLDTSKGCQWQMQKASDVALNGNELSLPSAVSTDWLTAEVPGTVLNSLIYNKVYPEPYYGMNNKIDRGIIPDLNRVGNDFYTYWFRTEFDVPADGVANDVFTIDFPENITQVHFIKLRLTDASGRLVGDNFYWRSLDSDNGERYHASGPCASGFESLADMPRATLVTKVKKAKGETVEVEVKLKSK